MALDNTNSADVSTPAGDIAKPVHHELHRTHAVAHSGDSLIHVASASSFVPNLELTPFAEAGDTKKTHAKVSSIKVSYHRSENTSAPAPDVLIHADGTVTKKKDYNADITAHGRKELTVEIEKPADGKISAAMQEQVNKECKQLAEDHFAEDEHGKKTGKFTDTTGMISNEVKTAFEPSVTPHQQAAINSMRTMSAPSTAELGGRTWTPHEYRTSGGTYGGNGGFGIPQSSGAYVDKNFNWGSAGGLDKNKSVDRVLAIICSGESGVNPTSINWNDNGHGISVGLCQFNQGGGELPMLFEAMASTPEGLAALAEIFGPELAKEIAANPQLIRQLDLAHQYHDAMVKLVHNDIFQKIEMDMGRQKSAHAIEVAAKHGITSEAGAAIVMYAINQFGEGGAQKFIAAADGAGSEEDKTMSIVSAIKSRTQYGFVYDRALTKIASADLSFAPGSSTAA